MKTIAIAIGKGGTGKTLCTDNIASVLANDGERVLVVDLDYQRNLTRNMGFGRDGAAYLSSRDVLIGACSADDAIVCVRDDKLALLPSHPDLTLIESDLQRAVMGQLTLRGKLRPLASRFDYCLIDCPPSNGAFMLNALFAADVVISPCQPDFNAASNLMEFMGIVASVQQHHADLVFGGMIANLHDSHAKHHEMMIDEIKGYDVRVFETVLPRSSKAAEAAMHGMSLVDYRPKNKLAQQLTALAGEVARC